MAQRAAIQYREFYDFPRMFIVEFKGSQFLFDGSFDDGLDDYPDQYRVSLLPRLTPKDLAGSWAGLAQRAIQQLGHISTSAVQFDATRRESIDVDVLRDLLAARSTG